MSRVKHLTEILRLRVPGERGAVLVMTALGVVVFMGLAAVAVDLSLLFTTRRQAQTVIDLGVLAGAQFAEVDTNPDVAKQAVIDEIKALTATNLGAAQDWATCTDPDMPPEFSPLAGETQCISFTYGLSKIRARLPDQERDTFFAAVIGVETVTTQAIAEVELNDFQNGDILPFGIPSAYASSTLGCPSDHPNGLFPCDGPDSGNFNRLQMPQWGIEPPPSQDCTHSNAMFEDNIADGIDHLLGLYHNPKNTVIDDKSTCEAGGVNLANPPGTVISETGVAQSTLAPGFILGNTGGNGFPGRLSDTSNSVSQTTIALGVVLDDRPLWDYIGSATYPSVPDSCEASSFTTGGTTDWDEDLLVSQSLDPITDDPDYIPSDPNSHMEARDSFEHMARCLREYQNGTWDSTSMSYDGTSFSGVLFNKDTRPDTDTEHGVYDLQLSPRWGWSPVGSYSTGVAPFRILDFKPVFINSLVAECNNTGCGWTWHAGESAPPGNPPAPKIESVISFQLPASAFPATVFEFGPGFDKETQYALTR